jgi:hypothetical protein
MRFKRLIVVAAFVAIGGTTVSACHDGRPGYPSDGHHGRGHHGGGYNGGGGNNGGGGYNGGGNHN